MFENKTKLTIFSIFTYQACAHQKQLIHQISGTFDIRYNVLCLFNELISPVDSAFCLTALCAHQLWYIRKLIHIAYSCSKLNYKQRMTQVHFILFCQHYVLDVKYTKL